MTVIKEPVIAPPSQYPPRATSASVCYQVAQRPRPSIEPYIFLRPCAPFRLLAALLRFSLTSSASIVGRVQGPLSMLGGDAVRQVRYNVSFRNSLGRHLGGERGLSNMRKTGGIHWQVGLSLFGPVTYQVPNGELVQQPSGNCLSSVLFISVAWSLNRSSCDRCCGQLRQARLWQLTRVDMSKKDESLEPPLLAHSNNSNRRDDR
jgi:hypothetical protein